MVLHFAYGSNMLKERFVQKCPSAKFMSIGYIANFRHDYGNYFSTNWNGHVATIVPEKNSKVYGCIWEINQDEIYNLDLQEGVDKNIYMTMYLPVHINKNIVFCYTYMLIDLPIKYNNNYPSKSYLDTIISGAISNNLPLNYIKKLKRRKHNNRNSAIKYPDV